MLGADRADHYCTKVLLWAERFFQCMMSMPTAAEQPIKPWAAPENGAMCLAGEVTWLNGGLAASPSCTSIGDY